MKNKKSRFKNMYPARPVWVVLCLFMAFTGCNHVEVRGVIKLKGNEPFTALVIETAAGEEYELVGDLTQRIRTEYQGQELKLAGIMVRPRRGPGFPARLEVLDILEVYP